MMRSGICNLPVIILYYLLSFSTINVSAADHLIFSPIKGYSVVNEEKGPGISTFARSSGNDIDVQGEKTVIRYELNSGAMEPGFSEIINKYIRIARDRNGWVYAYTDRTLYMGFIEQGEREYFAEIYIGDEYYDLIVVERYAPGMTAGGVITQSASNASQIQKAGTSGLSTKQGTPGQAQQDVQMAGPSSTAPDGLEIAHPEGTEGATGQTPGGGGGTHAGIQIVSPESDAILFAGKHTDVRWTTTGAVGNFVEIGYVSAGIFQSLAKNVPASDGVYRVTLPATLTSRNNSYALKVRSDRPPYTSESSVSVRIYPRVDLMIPLAVFNQREASYGAFDQYDYYTNVIRLTMVILNYGIDDLNEIRVQVQFINQNNEQLAFQGEFAVTRFFDAGSTYTVDPLLIMCENSLTVLQEQDDNGEGYTCPERSYTHMESGEYRVYIKLISPLEPPELEGNNTKILFVYWHNPN